MKNYIGTDIIEVDRVKKAMEDANFSLRVFTDEEVKYCESKSERTKYQHYAARFAAKEAVFKAISPLLKNKYEIGWKNIEILKDENDRPFINLLDIEIKHLEIDVSLSHVKDTAVATAIATLLK